MLQIKKGNAVTLELAAKDQDGDTIVDLADATAVKFMVKNEKTDLDINAIISKTLGAGITVDSPKIGTITIVLDSTDTDITAKRYYIALQIEYTDDKHEVDISETGIQTDQLQIIQDIIE